MVGSVVHNANHKFYVVVVRYFYRECHTETAYAVYVEIWEDGVLQVVAVAIKVHSAAATGVPAVVGARIIVAIAAVAPP